MTWHTHMQRNNLFYYSRRQFSCSITKRIPFKVRRGVNHQLPHQELWFSTSHSASGSCFATKAALSLTFERSYITQSSFQLSKTSWITGRIDVFMVPIRQGTKLINSSPRKCPAKSLRMVLRWNDWINHLSPLLQWIWYPSASCLLPGIPHLCWITRHFVLCVCVYDAEDSLPHCSKYLRHL